MKPHWEHFPHDADMGVRGYGGSMAEAFEQAALAMTAVITDPDIVTLRETVEIECAAADRELLFTDWLNTVIYEMSTRKMLFGKFEVQIDGPRLRARLHGEPVDVMRHRPAVEVKGATLTALRVAPEAQCWVAQTVVDV